MSVSKGVWGIDIGQCALKAVRLEMIEGKPTATAFDIVEHPKILSQPDADPDVLIRESLEKFLSRNEIKHDEVAIGIAGQSGLARFVKLPPVEEKKIAEIVKFEAKQQIPFPLDEVVWDFQKIAGGEVTDGFAMETEIGLFAMKRDVISKYLGYFAGTKVEVHSVQMSPLALVNFATYEILKKGGTNEPPPDPIPEDAPRGKKRCVVVMDIGTEASNLIITDGGKIIWQRPIPLGGNNFTRALTKELKLTFAKAEHLKRNAARSAELPQILKALKPVLQDFVGEVQRSLGYFTNTHRDANVAYMVGLGSAFRLPGLQKYLSEKLTLEVKKPDKYPRASGEAVLNDPLFKENILTFPVAYGLALQGLGEARLTTNLLPGEIRTDRLIRAKKPYAVAAAAALLLGTAGLAWGYSTQYGSRFDKDIDTAMQTAKTAQGEVDTQNTKVEGAIATIKTTQAEVKTVLAGQDERLNWPRYQEVFAATLPRPGSTGNLSPSVWSTPEERVMGDLIKGSDAADWFERRLKNGLEKPKGATAMSSTEDWNPNLRLLAMVNIETVYCRWVDNLPGFFQVADDTTRKLDFEPIANWMKPGEVEKDGDKPRNKPKIAEGGGWVFEIRGYTYHKDGQEFIKAALLSNLQRSAEFAQMGDAHTKVPEYLPGVDDPLLETDPDDPEGKKYRSRLSHAFAYNVWLCYDPQPGQFLFINHSYLDQLLGGGIDPNGTAGPGGPGGPSSPGAPAPGGEGTGDPSLAPATPLAPKWLPLNGSGTANQAGGPGGPFVPPPPGSSGRPGGPSLPGGPGGNPTGATTPDKKNDQRIRYEFVVMFVWREPARMVGEPAPADTTGTTGGEGYPSSMGR